LGIRARIDEFSGLLLRMRQFFPGKRPVPIAEYLDDRLIVFLNVHTQAEALATLVGALDDAHKLCNRDQFHQAILQREKLSSTGIGRGIAIPHAKLEGYTDFFIAVGIQSGRGIDWNSIDGQQVHLIFMIGGPDNRQAEYLGILSRLTQALKDEERRKELLQATSAKQVIALLQGD
jgi:PTS system nitrogen regulatory IIA component